MKFEKSRMLKSGKSQGILTEPPKSGKIMEIEGNIMENSGKHYGKIQGKLRESRVIPFQKFGRHPVN